MTPLPQDLPKDPEQNQDKSDAPAMKNTEHMGNKSAMSDTPKK